MGSGLQLQTVATKDGTDLLRDPRGAAQRSPGTDDRFLDGGEVAFGGLQQILALARPFGRQRRIAADVGLIILVFWSYGTATRWSISGRCASVILRDAASSSFALI